MCFPAAVRLDYYVNSLHITPLEGLFTLFDLGEIPCQTWKRRSPECESALVADEAENIQCCPRFPPGGQLSFTSDSLAWLLHTQPSKAHGPAENCKTGGNVWSPNTVIRKRADQEKDDSLKGKRETIGDEYNRVD